MYKIKNFVLNLNISGVKLLWKTLLTSDDVFKNSVYNLEKKIIDHYTFECLFTVHDDGEIGYINTYIYLLEVLN